ncbi:MAG: hypothetical protein M1824_003801 [Vezdaea acicularis]|nr:MAG: hypothetical protein M1824_003801 [Vezdaea acicularis]
MKHDKFPDKQVLDVLVNRFEDVHADHEQFNKLPADERMVVFMQDVRDFAAGVHDMMRYTVLTRKRPTQRRGKLLDAGDDNNLPAAKRLKKGKIKVESSPDIDFGTDEDHGKDAGGAAGVEDAAED